MGKEVIIALVLISSLWGQKRAPVVEGYAIDPVVITDPDCARDYIQALQARGVRQRKLITELRQFRCIESANGIYNVHSKTSQLVTLNGTSHTIRKSLFIFDVEMARIFLGKDSAQPPNDQFFREGWIIDKDFLKLSSDSMTTMLRNLRASDKK